MTIDQVATLALALPETAEGLRYGSRSWGVRGKVFAWERPFSKADIKRFGESVPPGGPILAISVADLNDKEAVLAARSGAFFTIPHFDGYPAVLVELEKVSRAALHEALIDGWLCCAPAALAGAYLSSTRRMGTGTVSTAPQGGVIQRTESPPSG
ncbi:MAG: hypothetical protein M3Z00_03990 [Actinomycetota bacterium]|nr:hypothetical protein [Actinomycetota bacterium]